MSNIQVKYDINFILSLKEYCYDNPFDKPILVIKSKKNNWNRGDLIQPSLVRSENAWVPTKTTDENEIIYKELQGIHYKTQKL